MCSLDISSPYANILIAESIDTILNTLYVNNATYYNGTRRQHIITRMQHIITVREDGKTFGNYFNYL